MEHWSVSPKNKSVGPSGLSSQQKGAINQWLNADGQAVRDIQWQGRKVHTELVILVTASSFKYSGGGTGTNPVFQKQQQQQKKKIPAVVV